MERKNNLIRVRVMAPHDEVEDWAGKMVDALESNGCEVIEWTRPYRNNPPEDDKSKIFLTAIRKENGNGNGSI